MRRLEAYGFKSFADKLEIEFGEGVTAIVGPNGSGKSNITDAIKWVLGEQNIRNLRGAKTEDIIFSGSATRRALGIAEASLTFDNSDGRLPLDFQEVVVTRRIFRSGESEFMINKVKCRLKDIHDLFADTGLGRDAIGVISQNKIDQVLNSKPEERRLLFEEAAGITKYRNRKKESLRKLDDTQQNILRVTDILSEIERQLEPLAERAEKTRRYNALYEQYRLCGLSLLLNEYDRCVQYARECGRQKDAMAGVNRDMEIKINLAEVEKERFNHELAEVEKSLQILAAKNHELGEQIERNSRDAAILKERLRQGGDAMARFTEAREVLRRKQEETNAQSVRARQELAAAEQRHLSARERLDAQARIEADLIEQAREAQALIDRLEEDARRRARTLSEKEMERSLLLRDLAEQRQKRKDMEHERGALRKRLAEEETDQEKRLAEEAGLAREIADAERGKERLEEQTKRALDAVRRKESQCAAYAQALGGAETRRRILAGMQEDYEGFGRAVKGVLKSGEPWRQGVLGVVAEIIQVKSEYITAVEIALGANLQNIVTDDEQTAKQAIEFLKTRRLGRATFLPLNTVVGRGKMNLKEAALTSPGFIGLAADLVTCEPKYRKVVDFLLGATIVADHMDAALQLARSLGFKARIVTKDGELLNPGGSMTGGSLRRDAGFLGRAGEIDALTKKIADAKLALEEKSREKEAAESLLDDLKTRARAEAALSQELEIRRARLRAHIEQAGLEISRLNEAQAAEEAKTRAAGTLESQIKQRLAEAEKAIDAAKEAGRLQKDDGQKAADALARLTRAREAAGKETTDLKIEKTVAEQEIIRKKESFDLAAKELERIDAELKRTTAERAKAQSELEDSARALEELSKANHGLEELRAIGLKDHDNFHQVKMDKLVFLQENDKMMKELRKKYGEMQEKLHQIDLSLTKYRLEAENCARRLGGEFDLSVEEAGNARLKETTAQLKQKAALLEAEIKALGGVNPNAISEYESLSERYAFMKKQADDLIVAKDYLSGIIREIDAAMTKQFAEAFAKINGFFSDIFARLFGGGQAKLELCGENGLLEAGIEIRVQPPDKRLQTLSVLSGGERALTVAALLFAFLKYKPAPFSVVDEIDAPLDEANVVRFSSFLKEYAKDTQFIVVTHRRGTMQAADVMHGVTVEESGVSRIVSVRMEDAAS